MNEINKIQVYDDVYEYCQRYNIPIENILDISRPNGGYTWQVAKKDGDGFRCWRCGHKQITDNDKEHGIRCKKCHVFNIIEEIKQ